MTSGTTSPTPTDSPSLSNRPLITTIVQHHPKKTVEFEITMTTDIGRDDGLFKDPESLTLRQKSGRLNQPRMSLLGRPLNYRASRRDAKYRRYQSRVYNFLERPRGPAVFYHMIVFLIVLTCLTLSVFSTIPDYEEIAGDILTYMESFVVVWFGFEFGFRLWSSGCRSRYQGYVGRLKFLRRPFCIIDMITIVASVITIVVIRSGGQVLAASALRGLRFFQILRMVRMDRRGGTWKLLGSVVYAHRQELITTLYIGFLGLIFASFLVFLAEKDVNKKFSNFAQALWWGVITLCTVGYGDMVPETWQGKIIASFCALLGISFFALPAGILGSGFALKVQQQQRQKHMIRRRQPAAMLIQSLWRCYAADELSLSIATWKIHQVPLPSPPSAKLPEVEKMAEKIQTISSVVRVSSSFKHNASFVSRLPTIRRHKSTSLHSPSMHKGSTRSARSFVEVNASTENLGGVSNNGTRNLNASHSEDSVAETMLSKKNSDDEDDEPKRYVQLTHQHKAAIRAIRKIKYFVARKKFREALKPYDVKDVIEQYSSGHADLLNKVRNLQFRLDQILGKQGSKAIDVYASKISLASRIVKVERQVDDIESKIDQLVELYMDDRKRFLSFPYPQSNIDRNASSNPNIMTHPQTVLKPKPILIDKQLSEPSSPITKNFKEPPQVAVTRKPMHRGFSDLGNRIKKRVTLSPNSSCTYICSSDSAPYDGEVVIVVPPPPTAAASISSSASTSTAIAVPELPQDRDTGSPRTITESSDDLDKCQEEEEEEEEADEIVVMEEEHIQIESEDIEEEEEDITETTLLCPTKSEIIISPMTLTGSTREIYSESISMTHLTPNYRNVKEDV